METYITGSRYEGDLVDAKPEGTGVFHYPDGTRYQGEFKRGEFHGKGTLYFPGRGSYEATWDHGVIIKGRYTFEDGLEHKQIDWDYCMDKDRRYWFERLSQLAPGGEENIRSHNNGDVKPTKDNVSYDCIDGYFSTNTNSVHDFQTHKVVRGNLSPGEIQEITSRAYKFSS